MTAWVAATATAVSLAAVGAGTWATGAQAQAPPWVGDIDIARVPDDGQAVRVFKTSGARIGVAIRDFNEDELKTAKSAGVVVEDVDVDSPAQKAGFKAGDIVVEFDGERVRSAQQLTRLVQETASGRPVQAVVTRDGQRTTLTVQPVSGDGFTYWNNGDNAFKFSFPKVSPPMVLKRDAFPPSFESLIGGAGQLGISVDELSPQLSEYFGTKEGVLVSTVRDNSNASRAGVKAGDVITAIDGSPVATAADLRRRAQRLEAGNEFTLGIVRDRKPMTLKGKIEAPQPRRSTMKTIV
jgi:serine protease Do